MLAGLHAVSLLAGDEDIGMLCCNLFAGLNEITWPVVLWTVTMHHHTFLLPVRIHCREVDAATRVADTQRDTTRPLVAVRSSLTSDDRRVDYADGPGPEEDRW